MDRFVILRRAGAEGAPEDPHHVGRRRNEPGIGRDGARPLRAGDDDISADPSPWSACRNREDLGPGAKHRHEIVAAVFFRKLENVRLLAEIEPRDGIERIGIGRGDGLEGGVRVFARIGELAHRRAHRPAGRRHVRHHTAGHVHGQEGVAVEVGVGCGVQQAGFAPAVEHRRFLRKLLRRRRCSRIGEQRKGRGPRGETSSCDVHGDLGSSEGKGCCRERGLERLDCRRASGAWRLTVSDPPTLPCGNLPSYPREWPSLH